MNERIRELAEQARYYIDPDWEIEFEVFVKLIVRECANIVWDEAEKTSNSDVNDAGYKIIEHFFGVEE